MGNKHKHYEMIVAKAANFDLIQFIKLGDKWEIVGGHDNHVVNFGDHYQYFLCLPQHKEAVLNCLNGGESQVASISSGWLPANCGAHVEWGGEWWYMNPNGESRIKPKKEKRVIGVNKDGRTTSHYAIDDEGCYAVDEIRITGKGNPDEWQFIEIEVEV